MKKYDLIVAGGGISGVAAATAAAREGISVLLIEKSGVLGKGAMIGISPVLSREVTESLKSIALSKEIPHQFEVMGSKTSTNADVVSTNREGVKCSLVSIPLRNMHTSSEIVDIRDIEAVANLLAEYIICR